LVASAYRLPQENPDRSSSHHRKHLPLGPIARGICAATRSRRTAARAG